MSSALDVFALLQCAIYSFLRLDQVSRQHFVIGYR